MRNDGLLFKAVVNGLLVTVALTARVAWEAAADRPVPAMPDGGCPGEYPGKRAGGCCSAP